MFRKMSNLLLISMASFLVFIANTAVSTTSFFFHGEPDCPKELLK